MIEQIDTRKTIGSFAVTTAGGSVYQIMSTADKNGYALVSGGSFNLPSARAKMENPIIQKGERMFILHPAGHGHHAITQPVTEIKPVSILASATP